MYGHYKEIILENLNTYYQKNEDKFDVVLNKYTQMLKENKTIKAFDDVYNLIENSQFDEQFYAKEFLEECIDYLKNLNKKELKEAKKLAKTLDQQEFKNKNKIRENIDKVVFSNNLEERTNSKIRLINHLVGQNNENNPVNEDLQPVVDSLIENRLTRTLGQLNEQELKVVKSYINNDNSLNEEFKKLVDQTENILENKKNEYNDNEKINLIENSKKKLNEMKNKTPNEEDIEKLLNLKE